MTLSLKTILTDVESFFAGVAAKGASASIQPAQQAQTAINTAASAVESALPAAANLAVNDVLAYIPGGLSFAPLADAFIDEVITQLTAKKSTAAGAEAA